jgi:hypothetical protein
LNKRDRERPLRNAIDADARKIVMVSKHYLADRTEAAL